MKDKREFKNYKVRFDITPKQIKRLKDRGLYEGLKCQVNKVISLTKMMNNFRNPVLT